MRKVVVGDVTFIQKTIHKFLVFGKFQHSLEIRKVPAGIKVKFKDGTRHRYGDPVWVAFLVQENSSGFKTNMGAIIVDMTPQAVWNRAAHVIEGERNAA